MATARPDNLDALHADNPHMKFVGEVRGYPAPQMPDPPAPAAKLASLARELILAMDPRIFR
jgi:hypothetical protein